MNYASGSDDDNDDAKPTVPVVCYQSSTQSAAVDVVAINHLPLQVAAAGAAVDTNVDISDRLNLPPPPTLPADEAVVDKIRNYLELKAQDGFDLTNNIRSKKNFGNPYIFSIAVEHFKIDEVGSNYPTELFDPHGYDESDYEAAVKRRYSAGAPAEQVSTGSLSTLERAASLPIASATTTATITATAAATATATATAAATVAATASAIGVAPSLAPPHPVAVAVPSVAAGEQPPARKRSRWDKP
jgi:hypothetical protein